jgi:5-methylcytosine-specific restriction endonuclease McrA
MGSKVKHRIDREELRRLYQTLTMVQLAKHYGCGETTIWARIKAYGIKHETYGSLGHRHRPREFSSDHLRNMSEARLGKYGGSANGNWKGGVTIDNIRARGSKDYKEWRNASLALRGFKCQECGVVDGSTCDCCGTRVRLHVHHVLSFAKFHEKRFDPENSEILCPRCHWQRHKGKIGRIAGNP